MTYDIRHKLRHTTYDIRHRRYLFIIVIIRDNVDNNLQGPNAAPVFIFSIRHCFQLNALRTGEGTAFKSRFQKKIKIFSFPNFSKTMIYLGI
jgi:hypothetical protein